MEEIISNDPSCTTQSQNETNLVLTPKVQFIQCLGTTY